ncbi:molybdopterin-containing oxidoreductase family protein [Bradyrhizobium septentrionale]|uniref:Molybdopterin-dependent oxidoreductase n=1 Tax=Bradyrhizobium septentrionale TaxID=1404411 RepID=A0ABZ2P4L3_9BRAD
MQTTRIRTTCPRDCYDACGIVVERRKNGSAKIVGDPDHFVSRGSLCGKCAVAYNGGFLDPSARLLTPLIRVGKKGSGQWGSISWNEALDAISNRVKPLIGTSDARKILHAHYTGTVALLSGNFPLRFFNSIGATEVDPDTVCNKAGHAALQLIFGDSLTGFDPRTISDARTIMVWGANPSTSAPHVDRYWLKTKSARRIVIDPIKHRTASEADLFLQPRPGSDAALAFSMLNAIKEAELLDSDFINKHCIGWPEIDVQIARCTPEWGECETGVPAELIRKAACEYARGPSLLWLGQGLQRQPFGGNVFRACSLLPAATGNLLREGTGILYMNGLGFRGVDSSWLTGSYISAPTPTISHMDLHTALNDPQQSNVFFTWNCNPVASSPQQEKLIEGLKREDLFHVAIDMFATDTVDYADLVLPAASFLEFNDLILSYFDWTVSAQVKAFDAPGEAASNMEIFRRLARAIGLKGASLYDDDQAMLDELIKQTEIGITFEELASRGTVQWSERTGIPFEGGRFPTPSGKIELAGGRFVAAGLPFAPIPRSDPKPRPGWWRVLSPANRWLMNSTYGGESGIRKQIGPQTGFMNSAELQAAGFTDGDNVVLQNETGELAIKLAVDNSVPDQTILLHKGRWLKHDPSARNVNVLNPGQKSDLGESSSVHGIEVRIRGVNEITAA